MQTEYRPNGWVYILSNPVFPEYLKIGLTTLDPYTRAKQLSTGTGIPAPYVVAWMLYVADCNAVERSTHIALDKYRNRNDREFFQLSLQTAIEAVEQIATDYPANQPLIVNKAVKTRTSNLQTAAKTSRGVSASLGKDVPSKPASVETVEKKQPPVYYSVETHDAHEMAPEITGDKLKALVKIRNAIMNVAIDCLWRRRGDGKITFTPLPHKDRLKFRNLTTIHLKEKIVKYRVGKDLFPVLSETDAEIEQKLSDLLVERS